MATLAGDSVDRPAVSFYEIGGWRLDPNDPDPFNVHNSGDWAPLIRLAEEETDLIRMCGSDRRPAPANCRDQFARTDTYVQNGSKFTRVTVQAAGRTLTSLARRDPDVSTTWTVEPLLKDVDDARAYLELPDQVFAEEYGVGSLIAEEAALGDAGIVMVDVADPICEVASLFSMADYMVLAFTEQALFHQLLEQASRHILPMVEHVSAQFPGRLWRVFGSEYASEPFLPPYLYQEYVVRYTGPLVQAIQRHGGYARIHSHGRLRHILPLIASMGASALDPIEPPPHGDMQLIEVRREVGEQMVLFGNIEAAELELLPPDAFEARVKQAVRDGMAGPGRGFVLMPSACPYGRKLGPNVIANYETMIRVAASYRG